MIKFKNFYYFESRDHLREAKESLKSAPGSEIRFYRNGKSLGQAFADINDGIYYPAVSLYRGAKVKKLWERLSLTNYGQLMGSHLSKILRFFS